MMNHIYKKILLAGLIVILALPVYSEETVESQPVKEELTEAELENKIGRMGDPVYQAPEDYEFSEAEVKMWFSDHLENITEPTVLMYEFTKTGTYEEGFNDTVFLEIKQINEDGTKNADMKFFTGERKQYVRPENVTNITGNPVLGIYMQGDIYEMDRYTGGSWRYFLKSIKSSIHDNAVVEPVEFEFSGKIYSGEKISFRPYLDDPKRRQFEKFANKTYELIFSEDIPGRLFQISTIIHPEEGDTEPLVKEVLTLAEISQ